MDYMLILYVVSAFALISLYLPLPFLLLPFSRFENPPVKVDPSKEKQIGHCPSQALGANMQIEGLAMRRCISRGNESIWNQLWEAAAPGDGAESWANSWIPSGEYNASFYSITLFALLMGLQIWNIEHAPNAMISNFFDIRLLMSWYKWLILLISWSKFCYNVFFPFLQTKWILVKQF